MKKLIFAAALCAGIGSAGAALADRWVAPVNGTVSAAMMPDGGVMMKIKLPPEEFAAIKSAMQANNNNCVINPVSAGETDSLIMVCGSSYSYRGQYTSKP